MADGNKINIGNDFLDDIVYEAGEIYKPIGLTHVEYVKGDYVGYVLAWISLMPIFLAVSFITLIIFRRDLHTICYFVGILLNEIFNWILKHTIKEYRPDRKREGLTTEYGMPSSHSQYMAFFSVYLTCFLLVRLHHNVRWFDNVWKFVVAGGSLLLTAIVAYGRVYLGYHTYQQVLAGCTVGCVTGVLWFCVVHLLLTPVFPFITASIIGELLLLRDSTLIPNILWFEYCSHRNEVRSRRKLANRKSS